MMDLSYDVSGMFDDKNVVSDSSEYLNGTMLRMMHWSCDVPGMFAVEAWSKIDCSNLTELLSE